jgi:4-amino-4-deoxy-L-arabinose transferase-like glycosyltransferase
MRIVSRRAVLVLIAITSIIRLGWAAALETSNDEAYHWLYTVHPDLSFFDHPPMTMWVEQLGISACGGWVHPLSLRLGFVVLFAGSNWFLFRWTSSMFDETVGWWAAVALNLSGYYTAFGGTFALPDSPFLFFSLLTFWQATEAIQNSHSSSGRMQSWLLVGLGFAGAMLSKYHAVLLPGGVVLYLILTSSRRHLLWSPGPYIAVLIGFIGFLPVLIWNATHDWASFLFQGGRAVEANLTPFWHEGPVKWLGGPFLYLLPWIWFWLVRELVIGLARFRIHMGPSRLLICFAVVPLLFFFVISGRTRNVLLHWPLIGFVPLYPLLAVSWKKLFDRFPRMASWFLASWIIGLVSLATLILVQARFGLISFPQNSKDPSADLSGWESIADELKQRGVLNEPNAFLFTNLWYDSGQLAFAIRNQMPIACYHSHDARGFAFWSLPEAYVGKTGFMIVLDHEPDRSLLQEYAPFFQRMELFAEFHSLRSGRPFRRVRVYRCENQQSPYPFDYKRLLLRSPP